MFVWQIKNLETLKPCYTLYTGSKLKWGDTFSRVLSSVAVCGGHKATLRDTVTKTDEYQANRRLMLHSCSLVRVTWSAASWPPKQISAVSIATVDKNMIPARFPACTSNITHSYKLPNTFPSCAVPSARQEICLGGFGIKRTVTQRSWTHARLKYIRETYNSRSLGRIRGSMIWFGLMVWLVC